ncbi:MAG: cytochrome c4 [Rhodocyclaceae bacterium]|nr:MAG: cytochrome c4 [Rhodocyclaceae bacterium]
MKNPVLFSILGLLVVSSTYAHDEETPELMLKRLGGGNAAAGRIKSETHLCQECHNADGNSTSVGVPKLAGQQAPYLFKQLKNFQSGEREHPIMSAMASGLPERDLADIAAYYSSQDKMRGSGKKSNPEGKEIFANGDWKRNLLACKTCHGIDGRSGASAAYPLIGGQHQIYLREQLLNWRSGQRKNSEGEVMNTIAKNLSDADIEALAEYISGL